MTPLAAIAAAGTLAVAAQRLGWLTWGGTAMAVLVGSTVLTGGGAMGGIMLGLFVVSGSVLTRWSERSGFVTDDVKGSTRDAMQVAANGLWAAVGALAISNAPVLGWSALTGALAAAQADTWATEIGARSAASPRLITTGRRVTRGASGGVTLLGSAGGTAGAILMALVGLGAGLSPGVLVGGAMGGIVGMHVDSLLGATVQAESGGRWTWCTNDVVNFACTGTGAIVAMAVAWVWTVR
ncbi:MAG: DUF92 domain-containing protein [Gemmatimonadales bacterium]